MEESIIDFVRPKFCDRPTVSESESDFVDQNFENGRSVTKISR